VPDVESGLSRLAHLLPSLERVAGVSLRVWRFDGRKLQTLAGHATDWAPALSGANGAGLAVATPDGEAWFEPIPAAAGLWLETGSLRPGGPGSDPATLAEIVGEVLDSEREIAQVAAELSGRYEEIDLLYTISEILGHTVRLGDAAHNILREVSQVVGARRATLFVHEPGAGELRLVAARGVAFDEVEPIEVEDDCSIAARVFREGRIECYDPRDATAASLGCPAGRNYLGEAYLSVPVVYAAPGGPPRPIGVINLTDRLGEDAFTSGDRKLVAAIANQIGAAIENARLRERDLGQQRLRRELELAHDLQLKLLPAPTVLGGKADVAARCRPAESVGGDFYNLLRLSGDRVGVMIGDVSSHGFGAALIMALALAAAGVHAESAESPGEVLRRLEESLADELLRTDMFLTLLYGVVDPAAGKLTYASAGHGFAYLVHGPSGAWRRLEATRPPLGLGSGGADVTVPWHREEDILVLLTDGIVDAAATSGARYGESRVLGHVVRLHTQPAREMLEAIFTDLAAFTGGGPASDDRTAVLLRA
jgi:sigma-B regulation protein RsbU (phosphoserine phosphatase)